MSDLEKRRERAKAAIVGSLVADAAGQPLHWVYDVNKIDEAMKGKSEPEFNSEWLCPFYQVQTGTFSTYGDQAYVLLQSLVEKQGFDIHHFAKATYDHFGPGTPYDLPQDQRPKKGPWRNGHITKTLPHLAAGVVNEGVNTGESDGYALVTPLIALYAGTDKLMPAIEDAVRMTLNNKCSVLTAQIYGRILENYILNGTDADAIAKGLGGCPDTNCISIYQVACDDRDLPVRDAVKKYGLACAIPDSFRGALQSIAKNEDYVTGVRKMMLSGGAIAPRLCAVGACAAAQRGMQAIPESWISRTVHGSRLLELAENLVKIM